MITKEEFEQFKIIMEDMLEEKFDKKLAPIRQDIQDLREEVRENSQKLDNQASANTEDISVVIEDIEVTKKKVDKCVSKLDFNKLVTRVAKMEAA